MKCCCNKRKNYIFYIYILDYTLKILMCNSIIFSNYICVDQQIEKCSGGDVGKEKIIEILKLNYIL